MKTLLILLCGLSFPVIGCVDPASFQPSTMSGQWHYTFSTSDGETSSSTTITEMNNEVYCTLEVPGQKVEFRGLFSDDDSLIFEASTLYGQFEIRGRPNKDRTTYSGTYYWWSDSNPSELILLDSGTVEMWKL